MVRRLGHHTARRSRNAVTQVFGIRRASDLSVGTSMLHACAMENALMLKQEWRA